MEDRPAALDRLDLSFRWGRFGIRILHCHLTSFPPGRMVGFHKHSEYEFHFIPSGKGKVIIEKQEYSLEAGMFYLTGPGVLHYQEADSEVAMDELCLHVDIVELEEALGSDDQARENWGQGAEYREAELCMTGLREMPLHPAEDLHHAMDYFVFAYRAWLQNDPAFYSAYRHAVIQIMSRAVRAYKPNEAELPLPERDMGHHRYQMATQYIQDNYTDALTLESVAERIQVSGRQLQRIFRECGGLSFSEYMESIRLAHVCSHLRRTNEPIEEIALQHGYTSGNYLYYVFKKKLGLTPKQYREMK